MAITDIYADATAPVLSYEFFPPKTDAGYRTLFRTIEELKQLDPGFVSVTMGAGGTTREKTVDLTIEIARELGLVTMCHLPCTGYRPEQVGTILDQLQAGGIDNVLALRGDPPKDDPDFVNPPEAASDTPTSSSKYIVARGGFSIGAACSPEVHPEAPDAETDMQNLKRKVDAGTDFLVSNLFLDNEKYFDFEARARAAGITVPDRARHHADRDRLGHPPHGGRERHLLPARARGRAGSRRRRRRRDLCARRALGDPTMSRADRPRRGRNPSLHAESLARFA